MPRGLAEGDADGGTCTFGDGFVPGRNPGVPGSTLPCAAVAGAEETKLDAGGREATRASAATTPNVNPSTARMQRGELVDMAARGSALIFQTQPEKGSVACVQRVFPRKQSSPSGIQLEEYVMFQTFL